MEQVWLILIVLIVFVFLHTFNILLYDNIIAPYIVSKEGFEDVKESEQEKISGAVDEKTGLIKWLDNKELYDTFYASIYDQLTQGAVRTQAECGLILNEWTKRGNDIKTFEVLDLGCGTGIAVATLIKMGVKSAVGMDISQAMLKKAEENISLTTLTDSQKELIEWKNDDIMNPSAYSGAKFTHAIMLYFSLYYFNDKETVFRNLFFWIKPGGRIVIHVVNKHKFDPMLESSAPWLGFSLQKYSDTRIKKSEVVFNKFKYVGEFDLEDPQAEFRETFRFTDGKVRRQRHDFRMEDMEAIVELAKRAGWEYVGYADLTPISLEYMYHLHFKHP